jgi:acyl carrier protein
MERNDCLLLFDELLELDPGTLKGSEVLDSLDGWDSLGVISFMALADENFGINLQPRQIAGCTTVAELIGLLDGRIRQQAHA